LGADDPASGQERQHTGDRAIRRLARAPVCL